MRIARHFTREDFSPYDSLAFVTVSSEIRNPDGSVVFRLDEFEAPAAWSQVACDVLAQKYLRKAAGASNSSETQIQVPALIFAVDAKCWFSLFERPQYIVFSQDIGFAC